MIQPSDGPPASITPGGASPVIERGRHVVGPERISAGRCSATEHETGRAHRLSAIARRSEPPAGDPTRCSLRATAQRGRDVDVIAARPAQLREAGERLGHVFLEVVERGGQQASQRIRTRSSSSAEGLRRSATAARRSSA
jgi:hypothetical protein